MEVIPSLSALLSLAYLKSFAVLYLPLVLLFILVLKFKIKKPRKSNDKGDK